MATDNKPIVLTFVAVVVAIIAMIAYFYFSSEPEQSVTESIEVPAMIVEKPELPAPEPVIEIPEPEIDLPPVEEAVAEPEEPVFVLPLLDDSDALARDGVVSMTRHEGINLWLASNQLIRKFVAFVDNIAHGQVAKEPVRSLAPEGPFLARKIGEEQYVIDPASYDRYNLFTEVAISVDSRRAAEFYVLLRPLMQSAYSELGYGDKSFDEVVFQAVGRLLETPVLDGQVRLVRPVVMYKFENDDLEALSPAQKQMIRMGPRNTRLLKEKISEVARELRRALNG